MFLLLATLATTCAPNDFSVLKISRDGVWPMTVTVEAQRADGTRVLGFDCTAQVDGVTVARPSQRPDDLSGLAFVGGLLVIPDVVGVESAVTVTSAGRTATSAMCATPAAFRLRSVSGYRVDDLPFDLELQAVDSGGDATAACSAELTGVYKVDGGKRTPVTRVQFSAAGLAKLRHIVVDDVVAVRVGAVVSEWRPDSERNVSGLWSVIVPLFAIALAIAFREALLALLAGIWLGATCIAGYDPFTGLIRVFDTYLPRVIADGDNAKVILFTVALGGMVGVISRSGGTRALVEVIARRSASRRSGMLVTWFSGLIIFFDDYANCLLVGNAVRPYTDKTRISREKLAFIVDSTAAPVSTIALISTWIGYQVSQFENALPGENGYDLFLSSLAYSFYPIITICFVFFICVTGRDFGPMRRAEERCVQTGKLLRDGATPLMDRELAAEDGHAGGHWITALGPVVAVITMVAIGLYISGRQNLDAPSEASLRDIISAASSYSVLLWASFGGGIIALLLALGGRTVKLGQAIDAWVGGAKAMAMAIMILVLAWALGGICKNDLQTGEWVLSQIEPSPHLLPFVTFMASAVMAFATGSSFTTMAIVVPIAAPLAWGLTAADAELSQSVIESVRYATLAAVLSGAVFGDHCSPISDTTIMASMSAAADHVDHVRTQAPYALVCAGLAGAVGFIPAGWGVSPMLTLPLGVVLAFAVVRVIGRKVAIEPA